MKFQILLIALLSCSQILIAQNDYDWETNREIYQVSDSSHNEILLSTYEQYDYVFEGQQLVMYHTLHYIVKVNNDDAVSANNRIYIPMGNTIEVLEVKARTFNPEGKIQLLDQNEIKEIKDDEADEGYRIFAIEGATVGGEIEYLYKRKMYVDYFGLQYMQFKSPLINASFKITSPENLLFAFKSYNGLPEIQQDTTVTSHNVYSLKVKNISPLKEEAFSIYNEHRKKIAFKINYNTISGRVKLFTWDKVGKSIYERIYTLEKKEEKTAEKILKNVDYKGEDKLLRAAAIEGYVKKNFFFEKNANNATQNFEFILKNKFTNSLGLTRLLANLYTFDGFSPEIVLTSDRSKFKLDTEFESYGYLSDYLIYLPSIEKYVAPYSPEERLFLTPPQFTANAALFTKSLELMGEKYPVTEVGYIEAESSDDNFDNMDVKVSFKEHLDENQITLNRSFKGYQASYIKSIYPLIQDENKKDLKKNLVKFMSQDAEIDQMEFANTTFNYENWQDPLILNSTFSSKAFIEKAGPSLLFKVGELIGPQSELYQEDERLLPVTNEYNRSYLRKIEVDLPEGYVIQNLKDLDINKEVKNKEGEIVFLFKSTHTLNENTLKITIDEYYNQIYYPKDKFEDFRSVINAAADFNKIVLVLKKS